MSIYIKSANTSMLSAAGNEGNIIEWSGDAFRLIPSRFPPVAVYEGIVANDDVEDLVKIENLTNPRLQAERRLAADSQSANLDSPRLQNWNLAPFAYSNPEGSRFFGADRQCLELADDPQTALAVSVQRRQVFLSRTNEAPIGLDVRMLKTPVKGAFLDFRHLSVDLPQEKRWAFGAAIPTIVDGVVVDGIIYHPPERSSAICIAVVRGECLQRSVQTVHYRYVWDGSRITKLYAFDDEGMVLSPETLSNADDVLTRPGLRIVD